MPAVPSCTLAWGTWKVKLQIWIEDHRRCARHLPCCTEDELHNLLPQIDRGSTAGSCQGIPGGATVSRRAVKSSPTAPVLWSICHLMFGCAQLHQLPWLLCLQAGKGTLLTTLLCSTTMPPGRSPGSPSSSTHRQARWLASGTPAGYLPDLTCTPTGPGLVCKHTCTANHTSPDPLLGSPAVL